jgi:hypothetical protein
LNELKSAWFASNESCFFSYLSKNQPASPEAQNKRKGKEGRKWEADVNPNELDFTSEKKKATESDETAAAAAYQYASVIVLLIYLRYI